MGSAVNHHIRMGRPPCSPKHSALNRGAWTAMEDMILRECITIHGVGGWVSLPKKAGLNRCGKSCRLRWLNYLRPDIKRGDISPDEEDLIMRLHRLLGNRWSLISRRLPGRTDNEIKNYWNIHLSKKSLAEKESLSKPQKKSKRAPPADDRVLKSTPVKAAAVRIGKSRNTYVDGGNYCPDVKRGDISRDEEDLIIRLHTLLGNRWSLIAGRLPRRTDNEIKNYWNTYLSKQSLPEKEKLPKHHIKSKRAPPADDRVIKSTLVKATAVRILNSRHKYVESGNSDHHEVLKSTDAAQTVNASKSQCDSLVDELMKEVDSDSIDSIMMKSNVESGSPSMQIHARYSPPCILNSLGHWKIPQSQLCTENEVKTSRSFLYLNDLSYSVFDLRQSACNFPEDFRVDELEVSPTNDLEKAFENNMPQVKNFTPNDEQGMEEMYDNTQQSSLQWLSLLLLESEEDWEERSGNLTVEDSLRFC